MLKGSKTWKIVDAVFYRYLTSIGLKALKGCVLREVLLSWINFIIYRRFLLRDIKLT